MEYAGFPTSTVDMIPDTNGDVIEISRKKKYKEPYPGFSTMGNGRETKNGGKSLDILEICSKLNTAEMRLMQFFRDAIDNQKMINEANPNKVVPTRWDGWDDYLKVALKKNFAHMECLQILRRVKRGEYMINPRLFIPAKDVDKIMNAWDDLDRLCDE